MRDAISAKVVSDGEEEDHEQPVILSFCAMEPSLDRLLSDIVVHVATVFSQGVDVGLIACLAQTVTDSFKLKVWDICDIYNSECIMYCYLHNNRASTCQPCQMMCLM